MCLSHNSRAHISKSKRCLNVKSSTYYFHMKTKILGEFQICISVPLIELPKNSILPTGFRFICLLILSNVFSWLECPNCWTANTLQLLDIEDKEKWLSRLNKSNAQAINLSIAFILHFRLTATKSIVTKEWKLWKSTLRLYTVSEVSGLVIYHSLSCVVSWTCHHQRLKMHMMSILFYKDYIQISDG